VIEGQVTALNFYPVKGARGIAIETARVNTTGLAIESVADREWMLVDRNRVFVSQREVPRLALVKPSVNDDALVLDAPGAPQFRLPLAMPAQPAQQVRVWSAEVRGFDMGDQVATWLTSFLERNVRLVRFDRSHPRRCNPDYVGDSGAHTMFADGYPLLVIGEESLADLNVRLATRGSPALPMNRFRPSVVVSGLEAYAEDHIDTITTENVALKLVKPCTRCQVTTTDQATARVAREPLTTLASYRRDDRLAGVIFGMNAIVLRPGTLRRGETFHAEFRW